MVVWAGGNREPFVGAVLVAGRDRKRIDVGRIGIDRATCIGRRVLDLARHVTPVGIAASELSRIEPLVDAYPFKSYRHYRVLPRKRQHAVMLAEIEHTLGHPGGVVLEARDGDRRAIAVARLLDWDSAFFAVPMGRIEYVLASDAEMLSAIVPPTLAALAERGVQHVSARVDVADVSAMAALESAAFA